MADASPRTPTERAAGAIGSLASDAVDTRKSAAALVEELGRSHAELLPTLLAALVPVLGDKSNAVARRVMQTCVALTRPVLASVAGLAADGAAALWTSFEGMRAAVLALLRAPGTPTPVATAAIKLCIELALALTVDEADVSEAVVAGWDAAALRTARTLVPPNALETAAAEVAGALLELLRAEAPPQAVLQQLINALAMALGRPRPSLLTAIVPGLCELQARGLNMQ